MGGMAGFEEDVDGIVEGDLGTDEGLDTIVFHVANLPRFTASRREMVDHDDGRALRKQLGLRSSP